MDEGQRVARDMERRARIIRDQRAMETLAFNHGQRHGHGQPDGTASATATDRDLWQLANDYACRIAVTTDGRKVVDWPGVIEAWFYGAKRAIDFAGRLA